MVHVTIVPDATVEYIEYKVKIHGISAQEDYDLDMEAIQNAKVRYAEHLNKIVKNPILNEDGLDYWWFHSNLGRSDTFRDSIYYFYFNIAKLRLVWDRYGFEEVLVDYKLDRRNEAGLKYFCDQLKVNFRNVYQISFNLQNFFEVRYKKNFPHVIRIRDTLTRVLFKRLICKIYDNKFLRGGVYPVIFFMPYRTNYDKTYGPLPELLKERGFEPLHIVLSLTGKSSFVSVLRDLINNRPYLHLFWFESPVSEKNKRVADKIVGAYKKRIHEILKWDDSAEWVFIMDHYANFSAPRLQKDFQRLEDYAQVMGRLNTKLWLHSTPHPKVFSKFVAAITKEGHQDVYILASYILSKTRMSTHHLSRELPQSEYSSFPRGMIVKDNISRDNMIADGLPESYVYLTSMPKKRTSKPGGFSKVSYRREDKFNILVTLQNSVENLSFFETISQSLGKIEDLHILFKPHPASLFPRNWLDRMMRGVQFSYQLVDPRSSLDRLAEMCDIGMTIYSTSALNIAQGGKPVVWVPYVSINHVFAIDLVERFGVVAYDGLSLEKTVRRLRDDRDYYEQQVERCLLAVKYILPEEQQPGYTDMMELLVDLITTRSASLSSSCCLPKPLA